MWVGFERCVFLAIAANFWGKSSERSPSKSRGFHFWEFRIHENLRISYAHPCSTRIAPLFALYLLSTHAEWQMDHFGRKVKMLSGK